MLPSVDVSQFLSHHGISLVDYGSAEMGLNGDQAIKFVSLLQAHGVFPLGIEVWRKHGNGWRIDSTGGWFVDDLRGEDAVADALKFLGEVDAVDRTVFTVQF